MIALVLSVSAVRPRKIAGYWSSLQSGALFEICPGGGRLFTVRGAAPTAGRMQGRRGARLAPPDGARPRTGRVEKCGRRISWEDGEVWLKQGLSRT